MKQHRDKQSLYKNKQRIRYRFQNIRWEEPVERAKKPGGAAAGEETVPFHEAVMEFSGAYRVSHKGLPLFGKYAVAVVVI